MEPRAVVGHRRRRSGSDIDRRAAHRLHGRWRQRRRRRLLASASRAAVPGLSGLNGCRPSASALEPLEVVRCAWVTLPPQTRDRPTTGYNRTSRGSTSRAYGPHRRHGVARSSSGPLRCGSPDTKSSTPLGPESEVGSFRSASSLCSESRFFSRDGAPGFRVSSAKR